MRLELKQPEQLKPSLLQYFSIGDKTGIYYTITVQDLLQILQIKQH